MEKIFKVGDMVEATWAGGRTSVHTVVGVEDSPHGNFYRLLDKEGSETGLHGKYLRLLERFEVDEEPKMYWVKDVTRNKLYEHLAQDEYDILIADLLKEDGIRFKHGEGHYNEV